MENKTEAAAVKPAGSTTDAAAVKPAGSTTEAAVVKLAGSITDPVLVKIVDGTSIRGEHIDAGAVVEVSQDDALELVASGRGVLEVGQIAMGADAGPGIHPPSMARTADGLLMTGFPASTRPMAVNDTVVVSRPADELPEVEAARRQTAPSTGTGLDTPAPGSVESASTPSASMTKPAAGPLEGTEVQHDAAGATAAEGTHANKPRKG